ncbi:hypothetical protein LTR97_009224 [Elasticomyces elasticus]|uniref:Uncharacterized protein n=1 Tax=Elasticomyces elasticus TaxID=574655 RepID=A0AAN7W1N6_9PEZI|nr:hypothetical protein LTR97_009224 [Elasticomyces elasticus]
MGAAFGKPPPPPVCGVEFYLGSSLMVNASLAVNGSLTVNASLTANATTIGVNVFCPLPPPKPIDWWPIVLGPPLALAMIWTINRLEERRRWLARFPRERGRRRNTVRAFFYIEPKSYKQPIPWDPTDPTFNREEYEEVSTPQFCLLHLTDTDFGQFCNTAG